MTGDCIWFSGHGGIAVAVAGFRPRGRQYCLQKVAVIIITRIRRGRVYKGIAGGSANGHAVFHFGGGDRILRRHCLRGEFRRI
jgi:hypothetical protein